MPRPPSKRSRPVPKTLTASKEASRRNVRHGDAISAQTLGSSPKRNPDVEIATHSRRDQTPVSDAQEVAIESSPMGERGATGSRPPTRSRGYSSTLSVAGRKGETGSKVPGTPAFESSILSNFRRRPRQPSILQMMQAEDGSSDFDDDDFLGGFSPEDESTPLNLTRKKSLAMQSAVDSSPSQISLPPSGGSRKRRRSLNENANLEAPVAAIPSSPVNAAISPKHPRERELHASVQSQQTPGSFAVSIQAMEPPLSSSLPTSPAQPLTEPRNPTAATTERESDNKINLPTTALQDKLLPRRRQRRRRPRLMPDVEDPNDSSDSDGSVGEQEEDELSYLPGQTTSRQQRRQPAKPQTFPNLRNTHGARKAAQAYESQAAESCDSTATRSKQTKEQTGNEIRGDALGTDKENNELNTSSPISSPPNSEASEPESLLEEMSVKFVSEELRAQALKFAEVDNWKMEYEDLPASQG
ncbi:hypothetical protein P170DRAFT_231453 [Aspergillus steynii IBT 23096]|uniref:Uncharacterized protein n=1 Tax=Aspergillus steynii IBT 23096 TaxID=1392250 RepID=A0A2I2G2B8_9EURO|nr:uncharacterized protein P170DRAFT_231453 [Aspergillus steynii IBT 23096]PLB47016.1 hypothetical protein P170DRAFT_231453 [Aspergillus steynii IBT 23096]